jgi:hypothetical protein
MRLMPALQIARPGSTSSIMLPVASSLQVPMAGVNKQCAKFNGGQQSPSVDRSRRCSHGPRSSLAWTVGIGSPLVLALCVSLLPH